MSVVEPNSCPLVKVQHFPYCNPCTETVSGHKKFNKNSITKGANLRFRKVMKLEATEHMRKWSSLKLYL